MNFYHNFIQMCNKVGVSPSKAAIEAGTTKTSVNRWKNGSMPTDATIAKLADYFGCSVNDLLGEKENPVPTNEDGISEKHKLLIELFDRLDDQRQLFVIQQLQGLVLSQTVPGVRSESE